METLFWQNNDINNFNIFMRDLSQSINNNLKHMIEDLNNEQNKIQPKKSKKPKKKDLIIREQNQLRKTKYIEEDKERCDFFMKNLDDKNPYSNFEKLKTDEGKLEFKFKLLERYWKKKKKYLHHVFNLYFHLKYTELDYLSPERHKIMNKIDSILEEYDYKFYMFENLGNYLPPLNYWDKGKLQFEDWQKDIIHKIQSNESVILRAPTSSGKTFLAMSAGILHKKILYICPAIPIAYQVGSHFIKMGFKVHFLIDGQAHLTYNEKTTIFIGVPEIIEKYIYKIGTHFNYAVFDEIHNLNQSYENIIRLLDCNFIALSATIQNSEYLVNQFNELNPNKKIHYIEYNQRFINQQRYIWNNHTIHKLHPCICLDDLNFNSFKEISFTPNDCAVLYEKLQGEFEDHELEDYIDSFSPDNYFKEDKLLTLNDSKEYETFLKKELESIYKDYPEKIQFILKSFQYKEKKERDFNFIDLFHECKKKDLFPLLLFHTKKEVVKDIFEIVFEELQRSELLNFPFHYEILEKKKKLFDDYIVKRESYSSSIKIKTKDSETEKREKMLEYDKTEKERFKMNIIDFYQRCIEKCKNTENETNKIKNLENELQNFIQYPDFRNPDIFKKHPDYCFTPQEPMSGNEIKSIRKEIYKATGKHIEYESSVFQLLKRGIGIYIEDMPDEYNWIVQRLLSQKRLGIVISDRTLCLGIDLPIRSVCLTGYKDPEYSKEDYLQMSGRAGRRGHDNQGNIIFHNVSNYKELMKGQLPELQFKNKELNPNYLVLQNLNSRIDLKQVNIRNEKIKIIPAFNKLMWYLREYPRVNSFIELLINYEKKLFMIHERDRELIFFEFVIQNLYDKEDTKYIEMYKQNKIELNHKKSFREIGNIHKDIVNSLHPLKYKIIVETSRIIFEKIKNFI